jgi:hypothetical protein
MDDSYQRNVARSKLTRNIAATFDPVHDELVGALREFIPTIDQGMSHTLEERADDLCITQSGSKYLSYQPCNVSFVEHRVGWLWVHLYVRNHSSLGSVSNLC